MSTHTNLIVVAPRAAEPWLRQAGFQLAGRMNRHTLTMYRTYSDLAIAMVDAKEMPHGWTWATEPVELRN